MSKIYNILEAKPSNLNPRMQAVYISETTTPIKLFLFEFHTLPPTNQLHSFSWNKKAEGSILAHVPEFNYVDFQNVQKLV